MSNKNKWINMKCESCDQVNSDEYQRKLVDPSNPKSMFESSFDWSGESIHTGIRYWSCGACEIISRNKMKALTEKKQKTGVVNAKGVAI